jgi:2-methylcitrate dehydratase PrpD
MAKSFHPGRAAQNGYASALLARAGFTAGEHGLEGPRGFAAVQAAKYDLSKITAALDRDWELRANTYKPFPCGIVNHPTIDGAIQIHHQHHPDHASIKAVRLRVAPLVLDLCNQTNITKGLQGKFSVYHGAAVGLVRGKAGIQEYTDAAVNDPDIKYVREHTTAVGDSAITEDQAHIEVELTNGQKLARFVEQSLGNIHRPLTDDQLSAKFLDQAPGYEAALGQCWHIDDLENAGELIDAATPR